MERGILTPSTQKWVLFNDYYDYSEQAAAYKQKAVYYESA